MPASGPTRTRRQGGTVIHDDDLADALRTLHPTGVTAAQVNERVDTVVDEVLRLRTIVRTVVTVTAFTFVLELVTYAYLIWAAR